MSSAKYHHGDLARALVREGVRAVEASGAAALSVKTLAGSLGVSHAAVYRHYANRDALLGAIAEHGFVMMEARMDAAFVKSPPSRKQLLDVGFAVVLFAVEHPRLSELMMGQRPSREDDPIPLEARAEGESEKKLGFVALMDRVRGWQDAGVLGRGNPKDLALSLWVTTLGLVALVMGGRVPLGKKALRQFADSVHERMLDGLV